ncbi:MAG TPA: type II toxin-antitoxin system HicB family antitoxin [Desulfovibrio sp.]|uniref:type II toxin-antitoxin system HicB family antitoxin n=1 Tax=Desulfovibrio sp. TaxID=885 RepID=UPI002BEF4147|nr:type II toxin-antitoxin system HicB family antitoxin [Desulfovibrio sp.]HMM37182.1 type II toxin-antitoxin system HicB family antitoxin [Desulfovibrio sp.]
MFAYPIELIADDNDTFLVTCPDLPEVTTFGEDEVDAALRALDAIEEAVAARIAGREDIPLPSEAKGRTTVALPIQAGLKIMLHREMLAKGLRKVDLARRLDAHAPQVDRLLDLRHASRLDQMEKAFKAVGKRLEFRLA